MVYETHLFGKLSKHSLFGILIFGANFSSFIALVVIGLRLIIEFMRRVIFHKKTSGMRKRKLVENMNSLIPFHEAIELWSVGTSL